MANFLSNEDFYTSSPRGDAFTVVSGSAPSPSLNITSLATMPFLLPTPEPIRSGTRKRRRKSRRS